MTTRSFFLYMVLTAIIIFLIARRPSILAVQRKRQGPLVDFYQLLGYFSGLFFIKSEMDPTTLWRTAALVHLLDAILCGVIAKYSGRSKTLWTIAGALCGIWALAAIFLLPAKKPEQNSSSAQSTPLHTTTNLTRQSSNQNRKKIYPQGP